MFDISNETKKMDTDTDTEVFCQKSTESDPNIKLSIPAGTTEFEAGMSSDFETRKFFENNDMEAVENYN